MAAGTVRVRVQVTGLPALQRALRVEPLAGEPLRTAFDGLGKLGVSRIQAIGPSDTGKLRASAVYKVGGGPVAKNVRVRVPAVSARRYRYPAWLNYASNSPRKGWLKKVQEWLNQQAGPALSAAAREIERTWQRSAP